MGSRALGPRSYKKTPNGGKTKARGKTVTWSKAPKKTMNGRASKAKAKIQRSKVATSKVGLKNIIYTRVSSWKQTHRAGFKRQQGRCEVKAGKAKTVKAPNLWTS